MLTGSEIKKRLGTDIIIEPFNEKQLNPNSYNVRLHNELLIYDSSSPIYYKGDGEDIVEYKSMPLDMKKDNPTKKIIIPEEGLLLKPNKLYLGRTVEYTETYNLIPCITGRSSVGRLGLNIHATASFGDLGFCGSWTLEMFTIEPLIIYPNIQIGQLYYYEAVGEIATTYNGRYQGQIDATASRFYKG